MMTVLLAWAMKGKSFCLKRLTISEGCQTSKVYFSGLLPELSAVASIATPTHRKEEVQARCLAYPSPHDPDIGHNAYLDDRDPHDVGRQ